MKRQLHLNLFIHGRGHHEASWRRRGSTPPPLIDIRYYQDLAQRPEAALFDSIFLADQFADGFNIMPPLPPAQLDVFSAEAIPILQRRGLFRTECEGATLREHYGLPWPKSFFDNPAWTAEPLPAVAGA